MTTVETALGPVPTAELGPTLMHEHVVTRSPGVQENWPHLWDRPGILANVSAAFTESGVNITEANCRVSEDGSAVNLFQFIVSDVAKLRTLMRKISQIEGVYDVERT